MSSEWRLSASKTTMAITMAMPATTGGAWRMAIALAAMRMAEALEVMSYLRGLTPQSFQGRDGFLADRRASGQRRGGFDALTRRRGVPEDDGVGFSPRYAFLDEGDRAHSMTKTRCHALFRGEKAVASFASKRVRFASVYVELEEGSPVRILQEDYMVLEFDPEGFLGVGAARRVQFAFTSSVEFLGLLDAGVAREDVVSVEDQEVLDAARWRPEPSVRCEILIACRLGHLAGVD